MITIVARADYEAIRDSFTEEEIKLKYGRLIVMSEKEYKLEKLREKNKKSR